MNYDFKRFLNDITYPTQRFAVMCIEKKSPIHIDLLVRMMKISRNKRRKSTTTTNNRMDKRLRYLFSIGFCTVDEDLNVVKNPNFIPLNQR